MKMSLLDMCQNILSALDSDPVDDIAETVESVQVVEIIRESYYELMSSRQWGFLRQLTQLTGLGDTANPTRMQIPATLNKIYWVKYNGVEMVYLTPEDFNDMIAQREAQASIVDSNGYGLNKDPSYWTSYDDKYLVFDSRDSSVDNTLQQSKSNVYGVKEATFTLTNTFTPDIPEKFFPTLLSEAKAQAFVNLKQQSNVREERKAQRGRVMLRNEAWRNKLGEEKYNRKVNYGRK
jgi:hypothetical protein